MSLKKIGILALASLPMVSPLAAKEQSGSYVSVNLMPTLIPSVKHDAWNAGTGSSDFGSSMMIGYSVGYQFDDVRLELGLGLGKFDMNGISIDQPVGVFAAGQYDTPQASLQLNRTTINVIKDFPVSEHGSVYIGVGIGGTVQKVKNGDTAFYDWSGTDMVLTGQLMAGMEHDISENVKAGFGYIYNRNSNHKYLWGQPNINDHGFVLSLRMALGGASSGYSRDTSYTPKSAPVRQTQTSAAAQPKAVVSPKVKEEPMMAPKVEAKPAPAVVQREDKPAPVVVQKEFSIFFDWDVAKVSNAAENTIREVAGIAKQQNSEMVLVVGHADTSGPSTYNARLSVKRAEAVKELLVKYGVSERAVEISGYGEDDLAVATGDNVRNGQNRRVVIFLK